MAGGSSLPIVIYENKRFARTAFAFYAIGALVLVAGLIWLYTDPTPGTSRGQLIKYLGPFVIPIYLYRMVTPLKRLSNKEPLLIVDEQGIQLCDSAMDPIKWTDLKDIRIMQATAKKSTSWLTGAGRAMEGAPVYGQIAPVLLLVPKDPDTFLLQIEGNDLLRAQEDMQDFGGVGCILSERLEADRQKLAQAIASYGLDRIHAESGNERTSTREPVSQVPMA